MMLLYLTLLFNIVLLFVLIIIITWNKFFRNMWLLSLKLFQTF